MDNGALNRDQAERYRIALDRHRADLLDLGVAEAEAAGRKATATQKRRMAEYLRANADNVEEFRASVSFADNEHRTVAGKALTTQFHVKRRELRSAYADVLPLFSGAEIRTDFPEPTPADLGLEF